MASEYKSVEKRIQENVLHPIAEGICTFSESYYGVVASMFRVPTFIRKATNRQLNLENFRNEALSSYFGATMGGATNLVLLMQSAQQAEQGNYIPLIILGSTNLASGIYELGRGPISKTEHSQKLEQIKTEKEKKNA